jgi:DNA-binding transcriptional regulator LsrR (DeoR family)
VGIGSVVPDIAGTMWAGYLAPDAIAHLRSHGAVGNICARHYDATGEPVAHDVDRRVVGIDLRSLHQIARVIGVAGGRVKAQAIRGALRGGHINVLITDEPAADEILRLEVGS